MTRRIDRRLVTIPFDPLEEYPKGRARPMVATVRMIDVEATRTSKFAFFFSKGQFLVDLRRYRGGFRQLLKDVSSGRFRYHSNTSARPQPPMSPLSLHNEHLSYVVYSLSAKSWQFARSHPPFSIGEGGREAGAYFEARRVTATGQPQQVDPTRPPRDDCTVAYFIADGHVARGFTGQYIHAINVHIDIVHEGKPRGYVPLIVDPDVRYPGGSGQ